MSAEEVASGKKSHWTELEISGRVRSLSSSIWTLTHLTALHINNNNLSRIPPEIAKLPHLVYLNLSSNKLRSLPAELGNMVTLRCVTSSPISIRMKLSKIVLLAFQDYYRFLWTSVICFPFYNKTLIDQQFKMDRMYKCI